MPVNVRLLRSVFSLIGYCLNTDSSVLKIYLKMYER